ncbi:MAG: hypothetical protein ACR2KE_04955 [Candidatus Nanopelagicales bacterium]
MRRRLIASAAAAAALVAGLLVAAPASAAPIGEADHSPVSDDHGHGQPGGDGIAPASGTSQDDSAPAGGKKDGAKKDDPKKDTPLPPVPPPTIPANLPAEVDPLASYQGQYICSPEPKPGAEKIAALIRATYVESSDIWIPRDCNEGGRSEHKEGRAIDWMINHAIPEQNAQAQSFLDWLLATDANGNEFAMARRLGIMYIGWNNEIWESYTRQWTELKGCYSTPGSDYDTYCHRDHIHLSLSWDGAAGQTSFWGGTPTPAPFCSASRTPSSTPADPGAGLSFVPVAPERVLDTRTGQGLNGSPCRLAAQSSGGPGSPVVVDLSKRKGSPSADARAVALRVTTQGSNSPATLRTSTGGALDSVVVNGRRESVTILPVASDGSIALTTDSGATQVSVDVIGYFVPPDAPSASAGGRILPQSDAIAYDSTALKQPLQPGEKRVIDVSAASTSGGPPPGALLSVTATGAASSGQLVIRRTGDKRTAATPVLSYRRNDTVTTTFLAALDADGHVAVVNIGTGPVDVILGLQASAVRSPDLGALLVPVKPATVREKRTTLARVVDGPPAKPAATSMTAERERLAPRATSTVDGATAAILQVRVSAAKKGGSVVFWSLAEPTTPSMVVPRQSTVSGLVVVPLNVDGTLQRTVVGNLTVDARVVAYLR